MENTSPPKKVHIQENLRSNFALENKCQTPYVEILEQPSSKPLKFRYAFRNGKGSQIRGVHSVPDNKTYPTIRIGGYIGPAVLVVSCVTKDEPYRVHPHKLVGTRCKDGICSVQVNSENMTAAFANVGILRVKKEDIEESLEIRKVKNIDPFKQGFNHAKDSSRIDLGSVRLCFQVFLVHPGPKGFKQLPPIVSDPIYDKNAKTDLIICHINPVSASVKGGQKVILLCKNVIEDDIKIRFFEEVDGQVIWEEEGRFTPEEVFNSTAIFFKTPIYNRTKIQKKIQVHIQLFQPSDGQTSEAVPFFFVPEDSDARQGKIFPRPFNLPQSFLPSKKMEAPSGACPVPLI